MHYFSCNWWLQGSFTLIAQKSGDNMLARGLLVAYSHNATSAEIRTYIEAFLGVQVCFGEMC